MMEISIVEMIQSDAEASWDSNDIAFVPVAIEQVVHIS
jgi:hypothetical protein